MDDLEVIATILGLGEDEAEIVLRLCEWVDHEMAIRAFGYPKDNFIPPPMRERLASHTYVESLLAQAREDEEVAADLYERLEAHRRALASSE